MIDESAWPADSVERRAVADLVPYARNSRTHSAEQIEQIAASIQQWGWTIPVLIDEAGTIIAGHARVMAAQRLNLGSVPVMVARGWSEGQRRAYVIADNKLALGSSWDDSALRAELMDLSSLGFDSTLTGFAPADIAELLAERSGGRSAPDDVPEAPAVATSRPGDVWLLGRHRIACGDSTDLATVVRALGGAKPNLMVTDPPYGVKYDASWRQQAGVGSAGAATGVVLNDDRADWREAWAHFPGNVAYVWHGALHTAEVIASLQACKMQVRAQIVWVKTRPVLGRGHYHWQHEPALYAVREGEADGWNDEARFADDHDIAAYVVRDGATGAWRGGRKQSTVWSIEHMKSDTGHSTQKPVECMRRPIENNSRAGETVYEPFSGSGTTLIACEMSGRDCRAVELNPPYVDIAVQRWEAFTGKTAMLDGDGRTFAAVRAARLEAQQAASR